MTAGSTAITSWTRSHGDPAPAAEVSTTWNGSPTWDTSGNVMTMRPNGNGNLAAGASTSFGFTVMTNGNFAAPPLGSCTASSERRDIHALEGVQRALLSYDAGGRCSP